ncbi:hypothetical protein LCGC14_2650210, partial [marine sediment metagenome]
QGFTNEAIQMAVDALPPEGGTVKINPGEFRMKAPVRLRSDMKLVGSGPETILKRIDGYHSKYIIDADFGELKVTVEDPSGFETGMSIQVTDDHNSSCWDVTTGVITDIVDNVLYFDTYLIRDYDCEQNGMVTNAGSCVSAMEIRNVHISGFTIDGNKENNDPLDGCNGGGIAIIKSKDITVENVHVRDFNGEGITWQITENITVRNCEISGCTNMGLHPGSGSPKSLITGNNSHHNEVGLFICWRVQHSLVENNQFHHNADCGISTGHKDSDVIFDNNHIYNNGGDGVFFRGEDSKNSPHRNTFINNTVENNGRKDGMYGFAIYGNAEDIVLKNNIIRDTEQGTQKAGIFIDKNTPPVTLENNNISGHSLGKVIHKE